ncbi:MAG: hypothetical protein ACYDBQ_07970 [Thermoplasmatota archaeon]
MTGFGAPRWAHAGTLRYGFDEDEVTLAWDAVAAARLAPGARLSTPGWTLPAWWWQATGLVADESERELRLVHTAQGPVACVLEAAVRPDPAALAAAALTMAAPIDDKGLERIERARTAPDGEADYPLGAHVTKARHEELLAMRLRAGPATVRAWTTIGVGAAPSEFGRLQDAQGPYHVLFLERASGGRTVGILAEGGVPAQGLRVAPTLRRLYRQQGAWRYGAKWQA